MHNLRSCARRAARRSAAGDPSPRRGAGVARTPLRPGFLPFRSLLGVKGARGLRSSRGLLRRWEVRYLWLGLTEHFVLFAVVARPRAVGRPATDATAPEVVARGHQVSVHRALGRLENPILFAWLRPKSGISRLSPRVNTVSCHSLRALCLYSGLPSRGARATAIAPT